MREATDGENPRYFVVENVPGLFSSKSGEDFKSVLEEIIAVKEPEAPPLPMPEKGKWATADIILGDGWSVAYRTLDAQHFGLAQRRKRLFLVADFAGQSAGKVLLSPKACLGILRRASVRGKELPPVLKAALERRAVQEESA